MNHRSVGPALHPGPPSIPRARYCARRLLRPLLRLLLATGLDKKELLALCGRVLDHLPEHSTPSQLRLLPYARPLEKLVARWVNHPSYLEHGRPMRLRLRGARPSFQSLVRSVAPNLSSDLALNALQQTRIARVTPDRKVELLSHVFFIRLGGFVDIETVTTMTVDFLRTQEFNFLENPQIGRGLFQRIAHHQTSDAKLAPVFNQYARDQGQSFLEGIDEWLIRHQPKRQANRRRKRVRLGVGIYVINETLC
jgi:hypothetical protein